MVEHGISRLRRIRPAPPLSTHHNEECGPPFHINDGRKDYAILSMKAFAIILAACLGLYFLNHSSKWYLLPLKFLMCSELVSSSPSSAVDPFLTPLLESRQSQRNFVLMQEPRHPLEQYMSYLPHSGFHNQRIAFENALVLAFILNRTLLVPPIHLGEPPIRYRPSASLRADLALSSRRGLEHCVHADRTRPVPEECMDFWTHVRVSWDWLVNLSAVFLEYNIRTLAREDPTDAFLARLGIAPADVFFVNDTEPYQFRFFDRVEDTAPLGPRYSTRIDLPKLVEKSRNHRLLQFGSLFGTTRLRLIDNVRLKLRKDVRRAMAFTNRELVDRADAIHDAMVRGGKWDYVAVHMRLGDGVFADDNAPFLNVRNVWWRLVRMLGVSDEDAAGIEAVTSPVAVREIPPPFPEATALQVPTPPVPPPSMTSACKEAAHPLLRIPLYIATDRPKHEALALFARTFSCVYTLSNFSQDIVAIPQSPYPSSDVPSSSTRLEETAPGRVRQGSAVPPASFMLSFLDALVASKSRIFVGTPGSTFSRFVEDVLWRQNHGWEIVERG